MRTTLARCRRLLGEDHPDTLRSAGSFGVDPSNLGEHQGARELDEDPLPAASREADGLTRPFPQCLYLRKRQSSHHPDTYRA